MSAEGKAPPVPQFSKLGKNAETLLSEGFTLGKRLELSTVTGNGIFFTASHSIGPRLSLGALATSYKHAPTGISLDKLQLSTDGKVTAEASLLMAGDAAKFSVLAEDGRADRGNPAKSVGKLALEWANGSAALAGDLDVVNGPAVSASALFCSGSLLWGGCARYNTQLDEKGRPPELTEMAVGVAASGADWEASAVTSNRLNVLKVSFLHRVSPFVNVAGTVGYGLSSRAGPTVLAVGGDWQVEPGTVVKGKVDSGGVVSLALAQKVNRCTLLEAAMLMDATDMSRPDSSKFGIGFVLTP